MSSSPLPVEKYISVIRKSGLVDVGEFEGLLKELAGGNGEQTIGTENLAQQLIARGLLTEWQNRKLLAGKYKGFFLGNFRILGRIGRGGMSEVYLARQLDLDRLVAIKVLLKKQAGVSSSLPRFQREARVTASLNHPNLIQAYDFAQEDDLYYFSMEYVEGLDLEKRVRQQGPLPYGQAVDYIRQAADGLEYAHEQKLIHRDVKPSNLLVDKNDTVKILDLGLAQLTDPGEQKLTLEFGEKWLGTADYQAPEQCIHSHHIDKRADIYGLGCTLFFLLTGRPPFTGGTTFERMMKHIRDDPPDVKEFRPNAPDDLLAILNVMLAKKPEDRYQSAEEVSELLGAWLDEEEVDPTPKHLRQQAAAATDEGEFVVVRDEDDNEDHAAVEEDNLLPTPPPRSARRRKKKGLDLAWFDLTALIVAAVVAAVIGTKLLMDL